MLFKSIKLNIFTIFISFIRITVSNCLSFIANFSDIIIVLLQLYLYNVDYTAKFIYYIVFY